MGTLINRAVVFLRLALGMVLAISVAHAAAYEDQLKGFSQQQGLFDIHTREDSGKLMATLPSADEQGLIVTLIHASSLRTGLGSNPVGLDRGLWDGGKIIEFRLVGDKVIVEGINSRYRATSDNPYERLAVKESFARSVLWATPVLAKTKDGRVLIDLTGFLKLDLVGISDGLKRAGQGSFGLDKARSFVQGEQLAFPDNVELEATLTFASSSPGDEVWATAPDARSISMTMHHSFVRLPDDQYTPRISDPRSAAIDVSFYDFSQPLDQPLVQRYARRFRLQRSNPADINSAVVKPIVFYIDRGAPTEIRDALMDGARWWAAAFEAAGFKDGYQVRLLPEGAHPLDIRYNVVQWVHRQTRGWSYGGGISDPRTGEMLKGNVILGSQRVRQDRMIFEGLAGAGRTGDGTSRDPVQLSLARIRQLAAHEIGHALGFAHNMAASADDRASVMDYPAPLVMAKDQALDFSSVYTTKIGAWDNFTVAWLYSEYASPEETTAALEVLVDDVYSSGLHFVADQHSRPVSGAHARGSLWDNGGDPVASLENVLAVRAIALESFDETVLKDGRSMSDLRTVFAPIYLYHRYQTLAVAKLVGGYEFDYALKDASAAVTPVSAAQQQAAIDAVVRTLSPDVLSIAGTLQSRLLPPLNAREPIMGRERFEGRLGPVFDPALAAGAAAGLSLGVLMDERRLARLNQLHAADATFPSVSDLFAQVRRAVYENVSASPMQTAVQMQFLNRLMMLSESISVSQPVRANASGELGRLASMLKSRRAIESLSGDDRLWQAERITAFLERRASSEQSPLPAYTIPPGSPIGMDCWHCDSADILQ